MAEVRDIPVRITLLDFSAEQIREAMEKISRIFDEWLPILRQMHRAEIKRTHTLYRRKRKGRW